MISDEFVDTLRSYVEFHPVCPEVEIGLGIPRDPVRVVDIDGDIRLIQPATGRDLTETMRDFANSFLDAVGEVDGFILKSRSPSCGIKDVKIYSGTKNDSIISEKSSGFFGKAVIEKFPYLALEDEECLTNIRIRRDFMAKIVALGSSRCSL